MQNPEFDGNPRAELLTPMKYALIKPWNRPQLSRVAEGVFSLVRNGSFGAIPHAGIGIVASELASLGFEPHVGDLRLEEDVIDANGADFVGISFLDVHWPMVKGYFEAGLLEPERVVLGGLGAGFLREQILDEYPAATIFEGYAEGRLGGLITDLSSGRHHPYYPAPHSSSFDFGRVAEEPYMDPELTYRRLPYFANSMLQVVELGRGCQYACTFCPTAREAATFKPSEVVRRELDLIENATRRDRLPKVLFFIDQNLAAYPPDHLKEIFTEVNARGYLWIGEGTLGDIVYKAGSGQLDEELVDILAKNCLAFLTGVEDLSGKVPGGNNKVFALQRDFATVVEFVASRRFPVFYSLVFGLDDQSPEVFDYTVARVRELGITVLPHIATPRAGTRWHRTLMAQDRMVDFDPSHADQRRYVVFKPSQMAPEQLMEGYIRLHDELFTTRAVLARYAGNLRKGGTKYANGLLGVDLNGWAGRIQLLTQRKDLVARAASDRHERAASY
jgi:radical SAM superfamily enzyme YgiQ (UPF0313 family)